MALWRRLLDVLLDRPRPADLPELGCRLARHRRHLPPPAHPSGLQGAQGARIPRDALRHARVREGGAITWVAMHRMHHTLSDRAGKDLHTPKDGFWWSHMGWIICDLGMDRREMERALRSRARGGSRPPRAEPPARLPEHHRRPRALRLGRLAARLLGHASCASWSTLHVDLARQLRRPHLGLPHLRRRPRARRNCWWVGLLAWGEGWHNNHHAFQRSARHGLEWWEFDANWVVIRTLAASGPGDRHPAAAEERRALPRFARARPRKRKRRRPEGDALSRFWAALFLAEPR